MDYCDGCHKIINGDMVFDEQQKYFVNFEPNTQKL